MFEIGNGRKTWVKKEDRKTLKDELMVNDIAVLLCERTEK